MKQMILVPHAGGFAAGYMYLAAQLEEAFDGKIQVLAYEYSGRGKKSQEMGYKNFEDAVFRITKDLTEHFLVPGNELILFGHSMGAFIAVETAYALRRMYGISPKKMFISGQSSPYHKADLKRELTDEEGYAYIRALGGTSEEIIENKYFYEKLYCFVKNDITMLERYEAAQRPILLDSDLYIMNGTEDTELKEEELIQWPEITSGKCEIKLFHGGHFYIQEQVMEIADYISERIWEG